jgi:tRNA (mo5U34)-methyltransferase
MKQHQDFFQLAKREKWDWWSKKLQPQLDWIDGERRNSDRDIWEPVVQKFGHLRPSVVDLASDTIQIGVEEDLDFSLQDMEAELLKLSPWRKGPFSLFGLFVDTEWRSDWKWQRVLPHLSPLKGRKVLDVGCGSGYHCWRMLGEGAEFVLGVDPSQLFWQQFRLMKSWLPRHPFYYLPLPLERFPKHSQAFDTVFSMGVLYHRKSPFEHLEELRGCLRKGGELVLETLVVDGNRNTTFTPEGRYASMSNVWFLPSVEALKFWLQKVGFTNIRCVDINRTTMEEQRITKWMPYQSLSDFLAPDDFSKTKEGHQAPTRAVLIAERG